MPAYSVTTGGGFPELAIKAVTWELKIVKVDIYNSENYSRWLYLYRHTGSTLSGGTAVGVVPLRGGATPATATSMKGTMSYSGTAQFITYGGIAGDGNSTVLAITNSTVQTPLDLTIAPGQVFKVQGMDGDGMTCTIHFEELRLSWSY